MLLNHDCLAVVCFLWAWASARADTLTGILGILPAFWEDVIWVLGTVDSYYPKYLHKYPEPRVN